MRSISAEVDNIRRRCSSIIVLMAGFESLCNGVGHLFLGGMDGTELESSGKLDVGGLKFVLQAKMLLFARSAGDKAESQRMNDIA